MSLSVAISISHPADTANFSVVYLNGLKVWFSYETPIAFSYNGRLYISENAWSVTTGKHLNRIDPDKNKRLPASEFRDKLNAVVPQVQNVVFGA